MTPIKALRLAMPIALLLGTALPASAQQVRSSFAEFGCALDTDELVANGVVPAGIFEPGVAQVGFITTKNCPGSQQNPAIQMTCEIPLDPDPGLTIKNVRNFTCEINGAQCGFAETFLASNRTLDIELGKAIMRCSRSVD